MSCRTAPRKQAGQIIIMMMLAAIPLASLVAYVLNGAELTATKTRLQNAADSAAMSEAAWVARSLNVMSMNNTAMTQSMAVDTAGYALEGPIVRAGFNAGEVHGFYMGTAAYSFKRMAENTGGFPFNPLFYYYAIKGAVFTGMAIAFYFDVVKPLAELAAELPRGMHYDKESGAFARAAEMFGRMNEKVVTEAPSKIAAHVNGMTALNAVESAPDRYYAFSETPAALKLPVVEQDFLSGLQDMWENGGNFGEVWNAADGIKNVLNICSTGASGTYSTPANLELDFFANFARHGYKKGTGPKVDLFATSADEFTQVHDKLDSWARGMFGLDTGGMTDGAVNQELAGMRQECEAGRPAPDEDDYENDPGGFAAAQQEFDQFNQGCEGVADFDINDVQDESGNQQDGPSNWFFTTQPPIPVWENDIVDRQAKIWRWACTYHKAPYSKHRDVVTEVFDFIGVEEQSFVPPGYIIGLPFGGKSGWSEYGKLALKKGPRRAFE